MWACVACVCLHERVWACACASRTHTPAQAVLFTMLSGRLWSHDHHAVPTAAMNHCIIEPPLDRRGEREEESGWAEGRDEEGGGSCVAGQGMIEMRWNEMQEENKEGVRDEDDNSLCFFCLSQYAAHHPHLKCAIEQTLAARQNSTFSKRDIHLFFTPCMLKRHTGDDSSCYTQLHSVHRECLIMFSAYRAAVSGQTAMQVI